MICFFQKCSASNNDRGCARCYPTMNMNSFGSTATLCCRMYSRRRRSANRPSTARSSDSSGRCASGCALPYCPSVYVPCNEGLIVTIPGTTSIVCMRRSADVRPTRRGKASNWPCPFRFARPTLMRSSSPSTGVRIVPIRLCLLSQSGWTERRLRDLNISRIGWLCSRRSSCAHLLHDSVMFASQAVTRLVILSLHKLVGRL